jgi:hypothetical protein
MNKYKVKVTHVFSEVIDISANNEEDAREKAKEYLSKEEEMKASYEATLPPEHWAILSQEKYDEMVKQFEAKLAEQKEESNIIVPDFVKP